MSDIPNGQETTCRPVNVQLLESPRFDRISAVLKLEVLNKYRESGNLYDASRTCGVEPRSLRYHLEFDPEFKARIDDIHREFVERAKGYMLTHMARPGNYMDRVTIARRFEPGVWGDQVRHSVEVNVTHVTQALQHAEALETTLEVEQKSPTVEGTTERNNGTS